MPWRAITSERPCRSHPLGRSPWAAAHHAGGALPPHSLTGDWAKPDVGGKRRVVSIAAQSENRQDFLIADLLSLFA